MFVSGGLDLHISGNEFLVEILNHLLDALIERFLVTMESASLFHDVQLTEIGGYLRPMPCRHPLALHFAPICDDALLHYVF